ncbi:pyridoxamine 5'-phosphate oxidase family protein [Saccharopolyspora griseoalba]|uniref:Pyridoxamine 5'-phosphate oxidase family protein n=1 Tax=Saccharopolyspora griseoalba TaxID=1431848 RepID=A0ABW2LJN2_9PSEU
MTDWEEFAAEEPELAATVRARLEAAQHHVLATLRADGSPRVSGTEVSWHRGHLTLGSMPGARKALDLRRDGRCALHGNPGDGSITGASPDVKISGLATEVTGEEHAAWASEAQPPSADSHLFRLDLAEVVTTAVADDQTHLVITLWTPERGVRAFHRS